MDARHIRVLVENLLIFRSGLVPAALRLERLGLQFLGLIGSRRFSRKFLRCLHGQLGKIVRGDVENFGIVWEVALQDKEGVDRCLRLIEAHGAFRGGHSGAIFELLAAGVGGRLFGGRPRNGQLERGKRFLATALGSEVDRMLDALLRGSGRGRLQRGFRFWRCLSVADGLHRHH